MPNLALYKFDSCPFCQMVMRKISALNLKVEMRDIMISSDHRDKLVADTGRQTVPCLYIDGKPMFESSDIVEWLDSNKDNLEKVA